MIPSMVAQKMEEFISYIDKNLVHSWNIDNLGQHIQVTAVVDPLTDFTQRVIPILLILRDQLDIFWLDVRSWS